MTTISQPKTNPFAPRRYGELQPVAGGVYVFRNITNSSFVVGDRSVAVVDTQVNGPAAAQLLKCVRSVTDKPIEYVINTHYHWDHTNGNQLFKAQGAQVIASERTREFMVVRQDRQKEFLAGRGFQLGKDPLLPEITFQTEHRIDLGNMPLRIFFAGRAETDDASAVHVVRENIVMSGDTVMTGSFPIFGQPVWDEGLEGDDRWIRTIQTLMALKPSHIVPGHGPLAREADVDLLIRIQRYFVEEVASRVRKGFAIAEILSDLESRLPEWITQMPVVWGTPRYAILRVYRGLTKTGADREPGWQRFKPSALPSAAEEIVEQSLRGRQALEEFTQMASEAAEGGDTALRLSILRKATEILPGSPDALAAYAEALVEASRNERSVLEKGDFFKPARECWDKALTMDPSHEMTLLGKGRYGVMMAYRGGDDPKPGMDLLRRLLEKDPAGRVRAEAEFYLGMGYRCLGDEPEALRRFKEAVQSDPAFMPAHLAAQC